MKVVTGTAAPHAGNEEQAARWVQAMFARVAPRYDLLNHLLSFNVDKGWRLALADALRPALRRSDAKVLDLCCGTGDVLFDLQAISKSQVMGADFCHPMLTTARAKAEKRGFSPLLFEADALRLPLADESLDAISIAFGFRNLANYQAGLDELRRVLRRGGLLAILEFSHPRGWLTRTAYGFYSRRLLPAIGGLLSGSRDAYTYLPDSIARFPNPDTLERMIEASGFGDVRYRLLTDGIAALHVGQKS